jgi:succinate dehydrogenase / fumarate reductase flavoprotein subunit
VTNQTKYETHEHDVLIIGAGGAGLRAAIEALAAGARVAVVSKSLLGKAHTVMAEGGIAAAMANVDKADSWRTHFRDTMRGGKLMNNPRMAQLHAQEAPDRVRELEQWGALFDRTSDGDILQRAFGGHTFKRLCHVGDRTGLEMIRTLQDRGVQLGFDVFMECTIIRLLTDGNRVVGAFGYWREQGRFVVLKAKAVVMATGGIGKAWRVTSNSWEYTGDGMALAYDAGAELLDMEFVQFHPTGMVWPPGVQGILVTEAVRGEGGILRNKNGERFMEKYDPKRMELSTRDVVARSIYTEVREGRGSEHGGAYLDISHKPADYVKQKLPSMYHQFKELADVDITAEPMEVGPTCHYVMGGVDVDPDTAAATGVLGLYAAGEVSGGMHGSNRLGGNSLSDLVVFGRRAGLHAAQYASSLGEERPRVRPEQVTAAAAEALRPFGPQDGEKDEATHLANPYTLHQELQQTMNDLVGIIRRADEMREALDRLADLRTRARYAGVEGHRQFNPGWHLALDLRNMLLVSECVTRSALERTESRGGHTRDDHPGMDPQWRRVVQACSLPGADGGAFADGAGGTVELAAREAQPIRSDLLALFEKDELRKYLTEEELDR